MPKHRSRSYRFNAFAGAAGASRSFLSALGVALPLLALSQALTSCGSDDEGPACEAGVLRACRGPGMCAGEQTCASDGSGYSECACDGETGAAGSAGAGPASGGGGAGGSDMAAGAGSSGVGEPESLFPATQRAMGTVCSSDADCPTGPDGEAPFVCLLASDTEAFGTGGPQGGYCSLPCTSSVECQALDPLSGCLGNEADPGYCISLCTPGVDGPAKCFAGGETVARPQACVSFPQDPTVGACFPMCSSDAACGEGLFCDLGASGLGLCTATPPTGGGVGAPCTEATAEDDCISDLCVTLLDPETGDPAGAFCSGACVFGLIEGCGFDDPSSVVRDALCLQPQQQNGDIGDLGLCFELCDTSADCTQADSGWECVPLSAGGQMATGRTGECLPPALGEGGAVPVDAGAP